ncbi:MAG: bifunctional folylpolyglutamate synthase/dihydrofolate synthase [Polyangiales bacterium]
MTTLATTEADLARALTRLYALAPRGARYGLEAMREACAIEGDPHDRVAAVHVAGTNGKGSVCATVASIARAAGLRVGLYTSPHLCRFAERIVLDGASIDDAVLARTLSRVMDAHPALTFFEVATLTAFLVFAEAKVDLAVIEVGLGGRLDATNVLASPLVTAITSIALDHVDLLGADAISIAREKAGISKPDAPVVVGAMSIDACHEIESIARSVGVASIDRVGVELSAGDESGGALTVRRTDGRSATIRPSLAGAHQRANTAVAVGIAWRLEASGGVFTAIDASAIERGCAATSWPGRLERLATADGEVVLDGAHNLEGAHALAAALGPLVGDRSAALIFGAMADKPHRQMIAALRDRFRSRTYVQPNASGGGRRAADLERLLEADPAGTTASDLEEALAIARGSVGPSGVVVVAGSLYLVGEARSLLLGERRDPHVGL